MKQTRSISQLNFLKGSPLTQNRSLSQKKQDNSNHTSDKKYQYSPIQQNIFFNGIAINRPKSKYFQPQSASKILDSTNQSLISTNFVPIHRKVTSEKSFPKLSQLAKKANLLDLFKHEISNQIKSVHQRTSAGKTQDKLTKINQDTLISILKFGEQLSLFAVCDGHGQLGHKCSQFIRDSLPNNIRQGLQQNQNVKDCLTRAFLKTNQQLCNSDIQTAFSGSTTVLCLIMHQTIYCANIGDSMSYHMQENRLQITNKSVPLSKDHKPDLPNELLRIEAKGGRVEPYRDYDGSSIGPARVWLQDADVPGLAMSRSFGDRVAASCGVISQPEIMEHTISENDLFMVIASDGVWEFLSNQQVIDLVYPYYQRGEGDNACLRLVKESTKLWKENDNVIDDITVIVVFFNK